MIRRSPNEERKLYLEEIARGEDPYKRLVRESDARVIAKGGTSIFALKLPITNVPQGNYEIRHWRDKFQ